MAIYGSYKPLRKAYFLNKWLHETDESLKDIWAGRVNLSATEQKAGKRLLEELKRVPLRLSAIPVAFLIIEGSRIVWRKMGSKN